MYTRTGKSTHYLPRKGSYSTHPKRNGAVEVLPPSARQPLYDAMGQIEDGERRLCDLRNQRDAIAEKLAMHRSVEQLQRRHSSRVQSESSDLHTTLAGLDQEIATLRRHVSTVRALLRGAQILTIEQAFMRIAGVELEAAVYTRLVEKAQRILAAARATKGASNAAS